MHDHHTEDAPEDGATQVRQIQESLERYWRSNVKIMIALLAVWALVGLGCGILFADTLNAYKVGGYKIGFWFAQQGSIVVFVVLILVYALLLNVLDEKHAREIDAVVEREGSE